MKRLWQKGNDMTVKETNLYLPVCRFFEKEGYVVQAEVNHCDLVAVKENEIILVELKGSFCLKLVYQAMERQRISDMVFVAIPRPKTGQKQKSWKQMIQLLERLDIGLLTVALDSPLQTVETVLLPNKNKVRKNTKKQKKLKKEISGRNLTVNVGGTTRKKIITAYREKALELCCILERRQSVSYKTLRLWGIPEKTLLILRNNYYDWFVRQQKGVYTLSEKGKMALLEPEFETVVAYYRNIWKERGEEV